MTVFTAAYNKLVPDKMTTAHERLPVIECAKNPQSNYKRLKINFVIFGSQTGSYQPFLMKVMKWLPHNGLGCVWEDLC